MKRICLARDGALGDTLNTLTLVPALLDRWPAADLTLVVRQQHSQLARACVGVSRVISLPDNWERDESGPLEDLRRGRFDLILNFTKSIAFESLLRRAQAFEVIDSYTLGQQPCVRTAAERMQDAGVAFGLDRDAMRLSLDIVSSLPPFDDSLKPIWGLHCGASALFPARLWPFERFIGLARMAVAKYGGSIVLVGNEQADPAPAEVLDLRGRLGSCDLAAVLQQMHTLIATDSGPLHLASLLDVPTVGIYTCTDPRRARPLGKSHCSIVSPVPCAGCYAYVCPNQADEYLKCWPALTVEHAWSVWQHKGSEHEERQTGSIEEKTGL